MRRLITLVLALSLVGSVALSAQKPKEDKGKGKSQGAAHGTTPEKHATGATHVTVVFNDTQRGAVRSYFVTAHGRGNCPPGLAKKDNGCLPPGQAKKRYVVGQRLANGLVLAPLPAELSVRVGAAPDGYRYGILDGDVLKLAVGTMLVVDAIEGLVR
jgi:hypothetical protein